MSLDHSLVGVPSEPQERSTVTGIYDKGSGALVVTENVAVDAASGERLVTSRSGAFIIWRPDGGTGGGDTSLFQTASPDGTVVIDRGRLQVREA